MASDAARDAICLFTWDGRSNRRVSWSPIGRVVLGHEIGGCLAHAFGVGVYGGVLVVELLRIVDHALDVALNSGKSGIFSGLQLGLMQS